MANATCIPSTQADWSRNSRGQSACDVAAHLKAVCTNNNVTPLVSLASLQKLSYDPPTVNEDNQCTCSSVVYSLVSECTSCQQGTWPSWSTWTANCETFFRNDSGFSLGIPPETAVPAWAFLPIGVNDMFDPAAAFQTWSANRTAEFTGTRPGTASPTIGSPSPSSSSTQTTLTPSAAVFPSAESSPQNTSGSLSARVNVGAIAGGIIGGFVGILLVVALVWWFMKRRRSKVAPSAAYMAAYGDSSRGTPPPFSTLQRPESSNQFISYRDSPKTQTISLQDGMSISPPVSVERPVFRPIAHPYNPYYVPPQDDEEDVRYYSYTR